MKQIRKNVFETNSSSTHSISISSAGTDIDYMKPNEEGNIILGGGEFGWEEETYNDAWTKANYCLQDIVHVGWGEDAKNEIDKDKWNMLQEVIKTHTGCSEVIIDWKEVKDGYIDHESSGTTYEAFESKESLFNFIFNKSSVLEMDNDNH